MYFDPTGVIAAQVAQTKGMPANQVWRRLVLLLALLGAVLAGIGGYIAHSLKADIELLARDGAPATAVVSEKAWEFNNRQASYRITLNFVTDSGTGVTRNRYVPHDQYDSLNVGSRLDVIYARSRPSTFRLITEDRSGDVVGFTYFMYVGTALLVIGLVAMLAMSSDGGSGPTPTVPSPQPPPQPNTSKRGSSSSSVPGRTAQIRQATGNRGFGKRGAR